MRSAPDARHVVRLSLVIGCAIALLAMLWGGQRNNSALLLVTFALWVSGPFVAFGWVAGRGVWPPRSQRVLNIAAILGSLLSAVTYVLVTAYPRRPAAFPFVVTPLVMWSLLVVSVAHRWSYRDREAR